MDEWQPKITTFLCNWCSYGAADLAGVSRFQYPPFFRIIRVPCSARVSPKFILAALRHGADGVWISGCHPGDCHYLEGNYYARRKFAMLKGLLEHIGIEPGRVSFSWISSAEATKFAETAKIVADEIKALGPAKHFIKEKGRGGMMQEYTEKIRETAKRLLTEGKVDVFIGYRKGTVPMMCEPVLISDPDKTGMLHWDSNCALNLCNYLTKRTDRIGIIANGCNSRNIVTHIIENQIKREQLYILGIPCTGMIDPRAVKRVVKFREIHGVEEKDGRFIVKGDGFEEAFDKKELLQKNCATCLHRNPVLYDELLGDKVPEQDGIEPFRDVKKIEAMGSDDKWGFFTRMISSCIRCYACRNACPLCYCTTCFVDEAQPQWVGKSTDPTDTMTFHILRAFHCAGRCTDCGACERACPMGINVRQFTKKLNKDALELFGWEAGLNDGQRPPLDVYKTNDNNDFIR